MTLLLHYLATLRSAVNCMWPIKVLGTQLIPPVPVPGVDDGQVSIHRKL